MVVQLMFGRQTIVKRMTFTWEILGSALRLFLKLNNYYNSNWNYDFIFIFDNFSSKKKQDLIDYTTSRVFYLFSRVFFCLFKIMLG